jgi:hypothetical protein
MSKDGVRVNENEQRWRRRKTKCKKIVSQTGKAQLIKWICKNNNKKN